MRINAETYHDTGQFKLAIATYRAICSYSMATAQDFLHLGEVYLNELATQLATGAGSAGGSDHDSTIASAREALRQSRRLAGTIDGRSAANSLLDALAKLAGARCLTIGGSASTTSLAMARTTDTVSGGAMVVPVATPAAPVTLDRGFPAHLQPLRVLRFISVRVNSTTPGDAVFVFEVIGDEEFEHFLPGITAQSQVSRAAFVRFAAQLARDGLWLHSTDLPSDGNAADATAAGLSLPIGFWQR
jgi:hypothetical protein